MFRRQKGSVTCTGVGVDCKASPENWIEQNLTVLEKKIIYNSVMLLAMIY